ncbi:MAG TPA: winged helix-turn-helix domain-containing protein [Mycobacteriales bacterium]|nr:winged helix-turn-helix domain-containing protein [Mycobacteriales bacterium]
MSTNQQRPDYELDDVRVVAEPHEIKAIFDPFRGTLLELLLDRAATVQELAAAVGRPKSTVAYHVGLLTDAGVLKVIRTRTIRGIEERFYGRTARIFYVGDHRPEHPERMENYITTAAAESVPAQQADKLRAIRRYAWISEQDAEEFWRRMFALVNEYAQLPRSGDGGQAYAFLAAVYPTDHPRLPDPQ